MYYIAYKCFNCGNNFNFISYNGCMCVYVCVCICVCIGYKARDKKFSVRSTGCSCWLCFLLKMYYVLIGYKARDKTFQLEAQLTRAPL